VRLDKENHNFLSAQKMQRENNKNTHKADILHRREPFEGTLFGV
jgi:hypothetical protein